MTFDTMSQLIKASDTHTHQCLDLSGEGEQIFVIAIPIAGLWHYFNQIKANGMFGERTYQLIMTSTREL